MGLDTIELVMRFEKEFKRDVPDQEAEKINTVGDMANWFYEHLPIRQPDKQAQNEILDLLRKAFQALGLRSDFALEQYLKEVIPKERVATVWSELANITHLQMPVLGKEWGEYKILGILVRKKGSHFQDIQFSRFVECVGALNYKQFVDFDYITSLFEVTIAVMGIAAEQIGVEISEVHSKASFVNDLGIE